MVQLVALQGRPIDPGNALLRGLLASDQRRQNKLQNMALQQQMAERQALMQQGTRDRQLRAFGSLGQLLENTPQEQQNAVYQTGLQFLQEAGHDIAGAPPELTPEAFNRLRVAGSQAFQSDPLTAFQERSLDLQSQRIEAERARAEREEERLRLAQERIDIQRGRQDPERQRELSESKAFGGAVGKARAADELGLGQTLETADNSLSVINDVLNHPGLEGATGLASVINPKNFVPGTNEHDFALAAEQIQGQAFLQAFESLKGAGQITEVEGQKATDAIAQLSRKQSTPQYRKALRTLRDIIVRSKDRAVDKATRGQAQPIEQPAPQPVAQPNIPVYNPETGEFE